MTTGSNSVGSLVDYIERIERLEGEIAELQRDRSEYYKEAEGDGFDPKVMRILVRERRMSDQKRIAIAETLDQYRHALGDLAGTPLGEAASSEFIQRAAGELREAFRKGLKPGESVTIETPDGSQATIVK